MRIALTYNLRVTASEEEAEFDAPETISGLERALARAGHRVEPFDVTHSLTSRMTYGNSSWLGRTGRSARSARWPWPISRRPGPRIILFSPVLYGGML